MAKGNKTIEKYWQIFKLSAKYSSANKRSSSQIDKQLLATLKKRSLVQKTNANDHAIDDHVMTSIQQRDRLDRTQVQHVWSWRLDHRGTVLAAEVEAARDWEHEMAELKCYL